VKQKMEMYKREKAELYDVINKGMQENERGGNSGAGPSNRAAAGPSSHEAAASSPSNTAIPSDGADTSKDDDASPYSVPSSNCAGPSGSK
jgi:hypothetical protein